MNKLINKIKHIKITPKLIFKAFFWLILFALYHLTEYGNQWAGSVRGGIWKIGDSGVPYAIAQEIEKYPELTLIQMLQMPFLSFITKVLLIIFLMMKGKRLF